MSWPWRNTKEQMTRRCPSFQSDLKLPDCSVCMVRHEVLEPRYSRSTFWSISCTQLLVSFFDVSIQIPSHFFLLGPIDTRFCVSNEELPTFWLNWQLWSTKTAQWLNFNSWAFHKSPLAAFDLDMAMLNMATAALALLLPAAGAAAWKQHETEWELNPFLFRVILGIRPIGTGKLAPQSIMGEWSVRGMPTIWHLGCSGFARITFAKSFHIS